jgi:hypothetical protein
MHVIEAIYLPQVPLFNSSPLSLESVNFIYACLVLFPRYSKCMIYYLLYRINLDPRDERITVPHIVCDREYYPEVNFVYISLEEGLISTELKHKTAGKFLAFWAF